MLPSFILIVLLNNFHHFEHVDRKVLLEFFKNPESSHRNYFVFVFITVFITTTTTTTMKYILVTGGVISGIGKGKLRLKSWQFHFVI